MPLQLYPTVKSAFSRVENSQTAHDLIESNKIKIMFLTLEMTYEMLADIDEDTALLRIFDTANTVM